MKTLTQQIEEGRALGNGSWHPNGSQSPLVDLANAAAAAGRGSRLSSGVDPTADELFLAANEIGKPLGVDGGR